MRYLLAFYYLRVVVLPRVLIIAITRGEGRKKKKKLKKVLKKKKKKGERKKL